MKFFVAVICVVLICSTLRLGVDAGVSTSCKDQFYDSRTNSYRSCKECLSAQDPCAIVCCKKAITVGPETYPSDNKKDNTIAEREKTPEGGGGMRPNVAVALLLSFFAFLLVLVLLLVLIKSMRDRAVENRRLNDRRCEGADDIQEVLGTEASAQHEAGCVVGDGRSVCSCQVKVMQPGDSTVGSLTSLPDKHSPV